MNGVLRGRLRGDNGSFQLPLVPWFWEERRAHCADGETEDSKDETFCAGLQAASDFIKKCIYSAPCTREQSPCLPWEDWLRR